MPHGGVPAASSGRRVWLASVVVGVGLGAFSLLADGIIAAQGTHAELLATEPRYAELMSGAEQDEETSMQAVAR